MIPKQIISEHNQRKKRIFNKDDWLYREIREIIKCTDDESDKEDFHIYDEEIERALRSPNKVLKMLPPVLKIS